MKNSKLMTILAGVDLPILANYFPENGIPEKTVVAKLQCEACDAEVVANDTLMPICPCCTGSMKSMSKKNKVLSSADISGMRDLANCESCGSRYVTNLQTLTSMQNEQFNCLICSSPVQVESDEDDNDSSNPTPPKKVPADNADPENDGDDTKDAPATDGDKELQDVLTKMGVGNADDSGNNNSDDSDNSDKSTETDNSKTSTETNAGDDDDSNEDDNEDSEDEEDEDDGEDEETTAAAVFRTSLGSAKSFTVIPTENYDKWFLFADEHPLAVSRFNNAEASVQKVFRSKDFIIAFNSALAADGGMNEELVKDFGFEPVNIDVKLDDISKQIIKDKVAEATKNINERSASLSELYDQCVGIASLGISKGIYTKGDQFRTSLIAKLQSNNVGNAEILVNDFMAKELPVLMRSVLLQSSELMKKSPEALNEAAEMVASATQRAFSRPANTNKVPLAVVTAHQTNTENENESNFDKTPSSDKPKLAFGLTAGLNRRV